MNSYRHHHFIVGLASQTAASMHEDDISAGLNVRFKLGDSADFITGDHSCIACHGVPCSASCAPPMSLSSLLPRQPTTYNLPSPYTLPGTRTVLPGLKLERRDAQHAGKNVVAKLLDTCAWGDESCVRSGMAGAMSKLQVTNNTCVLSSVFTRPNVALSPPAPLRPSSLTISQKTNPTDSKKSMTYEMGMYFALRRVMSAYTCDEVDPPNGIRAPISKQPFPTVTDERTRCRGNHSAMIEVSPAFVGHAVVHGDEISLPITHPCAHARCFTLSHRHPGTPDTHRATIGWVQSRPWVTPSGRRNGSSITVENCVPRIPRPKQ